MVRVDGPREKRILERLQRALRRTMCAKGMAMRIFIMYLALFASARAQESVDVHTLLEDVLNRPAQLSLQNVKLTDLLARLEEQTGVAVRMAPEVMALLPQGGDTVFTQAEFGQVSLREGLTGLFTGLGMRVEVQRDAIAVTPKPGLWRIGRRATWGELDVLAELASLKPGASDADLEKIHTRTQFQVPQRGPWTLLAARIKEVGAGSGDEVLDLACLALGWAWYPSEDKIVIQPIQAQFDRQLQRSITLRAQRKPFAQVLEDIGRQCGVPVQIDPAALSALTPTTRDRFTLTVEGYPAADALNQIASNARLTYILTVDGVLFYDPASGGARTLPTDNGPKPSDDRVVGLIPVAIGTGPVIQVLIRESDLPPELLEQLNHRKAEVIEALRRSASGS